MKNYFSLRALKTALCLAGSVLGLGAATITVDTVITSGLFEPHSVAVGPDGALYITDGANHRILRVATGLSTFTLLAGETGVAGSNEGVGEAAHFNIPQGIVFARGGLIVADSESQTLRFVSTSGVVTNLAGGADIYGLVNGPAASARFSYPLGLAADTNGNIYIADSQNNCVRKLDVNNVVTTLASGLYQPSAVAVGDNGEVWVTDTGRHCIKRISTNGVVTLIAGAPNISGTTDSSLGSNARFTLPRGLLWLGGATGLLVVDSGNHTVRRVTTNAVNGSYAVTTYAGTAGVSGAANGPALSATFNSPVGIASDSFGGGFIVVDKGNNLVRRINTGAVQPPVPDPVIGWVDLVKDEFGQFVTQLRPVISGIFNNEVTIATPTEPGAQIYFTYGPTPANPFEDNIPDPGAGIGDNPPPYRDGLSASSIPPSMISAQPDVTIKAIGVADGRRSSAIVQARFIFKTGNPAIVGDNAASFIVNNITTGARMWYTWDGSEPTDGVGGNPNVLGPLADGDNISFNLKNTNRSFKIRAFRDNFRPSDIVTKVFSPTNFEANAISFGFENGEASSDFVAAPGQRFYAPVTLSVLPGQEIYSFQFNVVVTNETGPSLNGVASNSFRSSLEYPVAFSGDQVGPAGQPYLLIPPAMIRSDVIQYVEVPGYTNLTSLIITNEAINLLGVGWVERRGAIGGLYPADKQDLIRFSQAHDTVFEAAAGKVVLGGYSFVVPAAAAENDTYQIQLGRASATSDGVSRDVFINIPTNGSLTAGPINGTKRVTVGSRRYVVGDVAPFRWFNAGDFGNTNLLNNDVVQVFQSAVYGINLPPVGSDLFDGMDSSDGSGNLNGNTNSIDNVTLGDGVLNVDDIYVTFRRSLDPSLKWFARFWQGGVRQSVEVPNGSPFAGPSAAPKPKALVTPTSTPTVALSVDDVVGTAGTTVQVPVRVHIVGGLPIRVAMLGVSVEPLDGAPALTSQVSLLGAAGLGSPAMQSSPDTNSAGAAWLDASAAGVSGDAVLATVSVQIPAAAGPNAAYRVVIKHFSASENGLALFRTHLRAGVVSTTSRTGSTAGDGISDLWRLRFFGSASSALSPANGDADHDGVNNLHEFRAGTNPLNASSLLRLSVHPTAGGLKINFPTSPGRTYVIESAPSPSGPWTTFGTHNGTGLPGEQIDTTGGIKFYRVRAQ